MAPRILSRPDKNKPHILFRPDKDTEEEYEVAEQYLSISSSRVEIPRGSSVLCRYSCLPFYEELERDLALLNCCLLQTYSQHSYVAGFDYYHDVLEFTPRTWFRLHEAKEHGGPYVLKGRTNSRKHQWREKMFAQTFEEAVAVHIELANDPFIGPQGIIVREYVPLRTFGVGLQGLPQTNEWRVFCWGTQVLCYGYYWSGAPEEFSLLGRESFLKGGLELVSKVAERVSERVTFFVLDVAEKQDGGWTLIEMNDGQMSGLSECSAEALYQGLGRVLKEQQG